MFEEIITSKEVKFNDLEKKVFKFACFFGCCFYNKCWGGYKKITTSTFFL